MRKETIHIDFLCEFKICNESFSRALPDLISLFRFLCLKYNFSFMSVDHFTVISQI
jgi:hypothetical protein